MGFMSAVGSHGHGHQSHVPVSLESHAEGAGEHMALKTLCSILCCVWGVFYLVKMLKNILSLIGIFVFLSCVGRDTSGWFNLELNWITELDFCCLHMGSLPC